MLDINSILEVNALYINSQIDYYTTKVSNFEIGLDIGIAASCLLLLIGLLIYCTSLSKNSPSSSIFNAIFSFFQMIEMTAVFAFVVFRIMYMFDYCEQVLEITDLN